MNAFKETKIKAAQIGQGAARILDTNKDGKISFQDAKYLAADRLKVAREWVDENDDFIEGPYNSAMRSIKISYWPGYAAWGWLFSWPLGALTWLLIAFLLIWAFTPRSQYIPQIGALSSMGENLTAIRQSLARIETLAPQIEVMNQRSMEGMQAIEELREFTRRVEKTKLFRKSAGGRAWVPFNAN